MRSSGYSRVLTAGSPKSSAHRQFTASVNQSDLKAQLYMKTVQERHRQFRVRDIAQRTHAPVNAVVNTPVAHVPSSIPFSQMPRRERMKSQGQLNMEVSELKKQRNKDNADLRMLKVELAKLQQAFKKYKEIVPRGFQATKIMLPDFLSSPNGELMVASEELLLEIAKIKNSLLQEIAVYKEEDEGRR